MKKIICFFLLLNSLISAEVIMLEKKCRLPQKPAELYIELIKSCLANTIYEDHSVYPGAKSEYDSNAREYGLDWPSVAHTMIGQKRLDNIHYCVKQVLRRKIPGDLIETGVWRGGATILMRAILQAYGDKERRVWVADSFEGLPPPNIEKYPQDTGLNLNEYPVLAVSVEQVQSNFSKYGLLDKQVVFLRGLFSETLPTAPIEKIAVLRLDGDLYESTMDALVNLYPKVSIGGYIIIDDYGVIPACSKAVHDYRTDHNITDPLVAIDNSGVFWKKIK